MNNWFYFLAIGISLFFVLAFIIIFICHFIIYFNVENTVLKINHKHQKHYQHHLHLRKKVSKK